MNKKYLVKFNCIIGEYEHMLVVFLIKEKLNGDIAKSFGVSLKKIS
jgi:hypothetical protein